MAKAEWGTKRQCPKCGTRFYDLQREPIICINCGTQLEAEPLLKSRRLEIERDDAAAARRAPVKPAADAEDLDDELLADDEDVDIEGDDELLEDVDEDGDDIDVLDTKPGEDEE